MNLTFLGGGSISLKIEVIKLLENYLISREVEFKNGRLFMRAKKRGIIRVD
ncbi:MAG: hypothetical protein QXU20_02615 [Candidatus Woesearchaeota archaeon]